MLDETGDEQREMILDATSLREGFESELRLYALAEHLVTCLNGMNTSVVERQLREGIAGKMYDYARGFEPALDAVSDDPVLKKAWSNCSKALQQITERPEKNIDAGRLVRCVYLLAGISWRKNAAHPDAAPIRRGLLVTTHPLNFLIETARLKEWSGRDADEVIQLVELNLGELVEHQ
jgi:hypothetical protein